MTREQILSMEPGRELDALIEEHVFREKVKWMQDAITDPYPVSDEHGYIVDHYSTDISAAFEVVEKMYEWGGCEISCCGTGEKRWYVVHTYTNTKVQKGVTVTSHTAPEAICKAALLAVMDDD